jgi:hypothetical protein
LNIIPNQTQDLGVVFPYFTNNYDFFTLKKKNQINNLFIILVIIIIFEKKIGWWELLK